MHSNNQYLLVVGTVEDADPAALGEATRRAPEKVMLQLFGTGLLETEDFAAFRIDAGQDVPDGAVLAGAVHALEDQQQRIVVGRIVKALQRTQLLNVLIQQFLVLLRRLCIGLDNRRPLAEIHLLVRRHAIVFQIDDCAQFTGHASLVVRVRLFVGFGFLKLRFCLLPVLNGLNVLAP